MNQKFTYSAYRAIIEREDEDQALYLLLRDEGSGADQIGNDGIYSRYFTQYSNQENTRYSLRCYVIGDDSTSVVTEKAGSINLSKLKTYPTDPTNPSTPICCGSSIGENIDTEPTGSFTRVANGFSFKVTNPPKENEDIFPPSSVNDLTVKSTSEAVTVEFTATGDDYDFGTGKFDSNKL